MVRLKDLFDIEYGNKLDLNKLVFDPNGIDFVSRTSKNNGISAKVKEIAGIQKMQPGSISVSLGGTKLLSSFVQDNPFYTAQNVAVLVPRKQMTLQDKLYICLCIEHNRFRYSAFGREANRTIKTIQVPSLDEIPDWVNSVDVDIFSGADSAVVSSSAILIETKNWKYFRYDQLFDIERGRGPRRKELNGNGHTPFITSTDSNNGLTGYTTMNAIHSGNTIGVNRNGSVGEAFYQPVPFCSTEDVHIFIPKFKLNKYIAMFLATLIRKEKYRYSYGRKWGLARMKKSIIKLPVNKEGEPDWRYMEKYIKTLPYSSSI